MSIVCVADTRDTLGEGCVADPRDGSVYWTDIEGKRIHRFARDGVTTTFPLPERAAFIVPRRQPGFVVGFAGHIALADASLTRFTTLHVIEPDLPQTRVNDAAVDPLGGIVFGTFDEVDRRPIASVYRLAPGGLLTRLFGEVTVSNGLAFSPDGTLMYFADTAVGTIRRFLVKKDFSALEEQALLARIDIAPGRPDGASVDSEGCYWNARVWGGCVVRISPAGELLQTIQVPAVGPTCVALGGPHLTRLFVTTLRIRQTTEDLEARPRSGSLFATDVLVPGQPQGLCDL
jgi:sugar lactone lactonase YvrE